jgi:hypothetical protein
MNKLYLMILILIVIFTLSNFRYLLHLTVKLKIINIFILLTILTKAVSHIILFYADSLNYIFILNPFISLGLIYIPLISFLTIVMLTKKSRLSDKTYIGILSVSLMLYLVTFRFNYNIVLEKGFIYSIRYSNSLFYQIYFYMAVIIFVLGIDYLSKIKEKIYYCFFLLSALLSIIDSVIYIYNIRVMPENIIGDLSFIILFNMILRKFHNSDLNL